MVHLIIVNLKKCPHSFNAVFMSIEHNIFDIFQINMWSVAQTMVMVTVKSRILLSIYYMALGVCMEADHSLYVTIMMSVRFIL